MSHIELKRHRRWYHWITQFSLRTLLMLVTLAAVACWWFLQPETRYEELAGDRLKLRRQVRSVQLNGAFGNSYVNAGQWRLYDEFDGPIALGRYDRGHPQGKWIVYYPSGRKAAEGRVERGRRTGLWKVWDTEGRPVSEVSYLPNEAAPASEIEPTPPYGGFSASPFLGSISVGNTTAAAGGSSGMGCCFCSVGLSPATRTPEGVVTPESLRHGPCRAWHPTGELRFEGQYERDQRVGRWTFYDQAGEISEQGKFAADRRDGPWTMRDPATGVEETIEYIAGRPRPDHDRLMAGIEADLVSGSLRRQVAAIRRLEELGPYGVPLLVELLDSKSAALQLLALRTLAEQPVLPAAAVPKLTALSDHASPRIALHALRTSYHAQSGERDEILPRLLSAIESAGDEQLAAEILLGMYDTDAQRRPLIMHHLLERLGSVQAQYDARWGGMPADHAAQLAERGWGVLPDLEAGFESANAEGRWFAILVLHLLVAEGPSRQVETSPGVSEIQCEIPAAAEDLLKAAKADADPRVREAAQTVGRGSGGFGFSGFGGQSGGFF